MNEPDGAVFRVDAGIANFETIGVGS